ncbi:NAD(P)-binding protein [Candidatus Bathyarchaeota archaeon]|nr:NAD(P)-binding protein [Candidatus Bathyarchaeota archaeon]
MTSVAVLGGGWAGILFGLEYKLRKPNARVVILEKQRTVGGLLRSEKINGHLFDIGGSHVIFSRNKTILNRMLEIIDDVLEVPRKSFIALSRHFVPYPLENNLNALPEEDKIDALISFLEAWKLRPDDFIPKNFRDWIHNFFGNWIAEKYLVPYNLKIWKRPLENIDVDWIYTPGRLPIPDWRDVVRSAMGQLTIGYIEQSRFYYPRYGGIQRIFDCAMGMAYRYGVRYIKGYNVVSIKRVNDGWFINNEIYCKKIVSSIPLNELVKLMEAPEHIIRLAEQLDYNRVLVVGLAIRKPAPEQHWIYVPAPDIPFHRYAWISNYSPLNAPPGRSTLIVEVTIPPNQPVNAEKYVEETLQGLEELGVVKREEIIFVKAWLHEYGYPVHTTTSNRARSEVLHWLNEWGITPIGRWGCWQYWNMDKVYEDIIEKSSF